MKRITVVRKALGLTMSGLAREAGIHVSSMSQIENGRLAPYPGQVQKLVRTLKWNGEPRELFLEVAE